MSRSGVVSRLAAGAALTLASLPLWACGSESVRERLVLITLDTLRYDSFGGSAARDPDMPHLRAWAEEARVFRRHYAATSTTQPTHASVFTGLHPWRHGVTRNGMVLDAAHETVAERIRAAGFDTAAVVASFALHRRFGFDQGFERFRDEFNAGRRQRWNDVEVPGAHFYSTADHVTAQALELLDATRAPRQFFWFHYFDPHQPYGDSAGGPSLALGDVKRDLVAGAPGAHEQIAEARRGYDRDVRVLDAALGRLLRRLLDDAGEFETHVLVVSDHGESFGEGLALGHGESLGVEQIHVPLLLRSPRVAPGETDVPVGSVDLAATLLSLAGAAPLPTAGIDLTRLPEVPAERPVAGMRRTFATPFEDVLADGSTRLVQGLEFYLVSGERIFRGDATAVRADDGSTPTAAQREGVASLFRGFEAELAQSTAAELLDAQSRSALEALGYVR